MARLLSSGGQRVARIRTPGFSAPPGRRRQPGPARPQLPRASVAALSPPRRWAVVGLVRAPPRVAPTLRSVALQGDLHWLLCC